MDSQPRANPGSAGQGKSPYDQLLASLVEVGKRAFDPNSAEESRDASQKEFDELIQSAGTIAIIPALNTLIHPGRVPDWLRARFVDILATVPLRHYGVRATLEFVFAVHPSSAAGPAGTGEAPGKQGASITHEAMAMASRLLANPPVSVDADLWFSGIAPQLLELLDGRNGLELTKVAAYVVGFGILGRRQYGAPGTPGWRYFIEPMLQAIKPDERTLERSPQDATGEDGVLDLSKDGVVVTPADLATALRRLQSLVISHPNPGLSRRLLRPLVLPLWCLVSKRSFGDDQEVEYRRPARNLLTIFLKVVGSLEPVTAIIDNLVYDGETQDGPELWSYSTAADGGIQIAAPRKPEFLNTADAIDIVEIEARNRTLLDLIGSIYPDEDISSIFLNLFNRWLQSGAKQKTKSSVLLTQSRNDDGQNPVLLLLEGQALQEMMQRFSDKLAGQPAHILELADQLISKSNSLGHDDEVVAVALSLLGVIAYTPNFQKSKVDKALMQSIEASLDRIGRSGKGDSATSAANLAVFLKSHDEPDPAGNTETVSSSQTDPRVEDRKTYALAVSYITQRDSPPPVRSEGLNLIQGLIQANSPILDVPGILVLMSSLLVENEDYINLRIIKIYTQLANRHPKSVTRELVDRYVDANEMASLDTRLRFGEALLQVIERLGETFAGDAAKEVCHALLMIAGRRAHRPKTKAKQARDEKMRKMKAERGGTNDNDDDDDEEPIDMSDREKADNKILAQIVEGWTSKRGAEDVRIRGSALSIFAVAIETNIAGIGPDLVSSAVDLCMQTLSIEKGVETGILRRAAVLVVLSFVRALDATRQARRQLGFGLTDESRRNITRILEYIADTDSDGLVKQHARDVVESLENWTLSTLLPITDAQAAASSPGLSGLAGLRVVGLGGDADGGGGHSGARPVIEEME